MALLLDKGFLISLSSSDSCFVCVGRNVGMLFAGVDFEGLVGLSYNDPLDFDPLKNPFLSPNEVVFVTGDSTAFFIVISNTCKHHTGEALC
jgi:hypothetical protein